MRIGLIYVLQVIHLSVRLHESFADDYDDQPDYDKIAYGGVIKHITTSFPNEHDLEFLAMLEKLKHYVSNRHPSAMFIDQSINCYAKLNLWYTKSDVFPLAFERHVTSVTGVEYPVSVPASLGSTYNCQVRLMEKRFDLLLYVTLTKEYWDESFYVYSHIYFPISKTYGETRITADSCVRSETPYELRVLSSLSREKFLLRCISSVEVEMQARLTQVLLNYDLMANEGQSNMNDPQAQPSSLKIMTYNIWNFNPYSDNNSYRKRLYSLLKLVKRADPDVICFQEVRFQNFMGGEVGPSQIDHLATFLSDYQFVYQPAQVQDNTMRDGRSEEGLAVFSKFPIIHHDYLLLFRNKSNSADGHQRICLHAALAIPGIGQVHVFNTHYSLSHEAREAASSQIHRFMASYSGPAVLLGDLNAVPDEKSVKMLVNTDTGLIDAWTLLHGTEPGYTFSTLEDDLSKRIDYILLRRTKHVVVTNVEVLHDERRSQAASDHRAVQATLRFNNDFDVG